jgi:hypothetical protein
MFLTLPAKRVSLSANKPPIVFLGGLDDAFLGGSLRTEAGHQGAILTAQDHYVRVRLVEVIVKLGKSELFHP